MDLLIVACSAELGAALVAVTGALVALTTEAKRRWTARAIQSGRRADRRSPGLERRRSATGPGR